MTLSPTSVLLGTLAPVVFALANLTPAALRPGDGAPPRTPVAAPAPAVPLPAVRPAPSAPTRLPIPFPRPVGAALPTAVPELAVPAARESNPFRRRLGVVDSLRVEKGAHRLTLFRGGAAVAAYSIAIGKSPVGHKERAGDNRTPEGLYHIDARNPASRFHLGLHVSYPNAADRARAARLGIQPGGDIMIHGLPNGQGGVGAAHRQYDWTNGCVALTNEEMEEVWESVPVGTPIRILP